MHEMQAHRVAGRLNLITSYVQGSNMGIAMHDYPEQASMRLSR
jgi:hypothetical protein